MTMNPVRYETIAANIGKVQVNGAEVQVTWKDPESGREVGRSSGYMSPDSSIGNRVGASVKRTIVSEVVYGLARFISGRIGGAAGRVISNATYTAAGDLNTRATANVDYTEASRRAAIVSAFVSVRPSFHWDDQRQQFRPK
jgi:hypothetical protein